MLTYNCKMSPSKGCAFYLSNSQVFKCGQRKRCGYQTIRHPFEGPFRILWVKAARQKRNGHLEAESAINGGASWEEDYKNQRKQRGDRDGENWTVTVAWRENERKIFFQGD